MTGNGRTLQRGRTSAPCSLHRRHEPAATYSELHHVVPQAWQVLWQPAQPWLNGGPSHDHAGRLLWDARTVPICRTGHGNVHFWLVRLTKAAHRLGSIGAGLHELRAEARVHGQDPGRRDLETAILGLQRWLDAGGTLDQLAAAGLWGEI